MKRCELERHLTAHGCDVLREAPTTPSGTTRPPTCASPCPGTARSRRHCIARSANNSRSLRHRERAEAGCPTDQAPRGNVQRDRSVERFWIVPTSGLVRLARDANDDACDTDHWTDHLNHKEPAARPTIKPCGVFPVSLEPFVDAPDAAASLQRPDNRDDAGKLCDEALGRLRRIAAWEVVAAKVVWNSPDLAPCRAKRNGARRRGGVSAGASHGDF